MEKKQINLHQILKSYKEEMKIAEEEGSLHRQVFKYLKIFFLFRSLVITLLLNCALWILVSP